MGIPKKGSHVADVDGHPFRYLVREKNVSEAHRNTKTLLVTIQEDTESPGNVLQFRASYGYPVTNTWIAIMVRRALEAGWKPSKRGPAFIVGNPDFVPDDMEDD